MEMSRSLYQITLYPFSGHYVTVHFRFARRAHKGFPDPWGIHVETMAGPQINGIDLDETFTRRQGVLISYRDYILGSLHNLLVHSYGGSFGIYRDYPEIDGIVVL